MTRTNGIADAYDRQAEFRHEELHLEAVVPTIDATIRHLEEPRPTYGGTPQAADIIKGMKDDDLGRLRGARNRPYFGRVDYAPDARGDDKTIYIGDVNVQHEDPKYFIASRHAPIARLYYVPEEGCYETAANLKRGIPRKRHDAAVHLKRTLRLRMRGCSLSRTS